MLACLFGSVPTNVLMYVLVSQLLKADAVGEGFAARLEGEGSVHVAQGESLSVHGAD